MNLSTNVKINFTIRERFQKLIVNPGRASSIFNIIRQKDICDVRLLVKHGVYGAPLYGAVEKPKSSMINYTLFKANL